VRWSLGRGIWRQVNRPLGRKGWRIEIAPLDTEPANAARSVDLKNSAIATSGDIFQKLELDGVRYSHIVNPKTGLGLTDHSLVTVLARTCMQADSLATALSVLGPTKGLRLIQKTDGVEARVVRFSEGKLEKRFSSGFERRLIKP
jgi:FAD:protein FMN transferase